MLGNKKDSFSNFISEWSAEYPYDYFWRKKYNIPFGSKEHLESNHIYMLLDLFEEQQMNNIIKRRSEEFEYIDESNYDSKLGIVSEKPVQVIKMSKEEIDEEFDQLNLSDFNNI